MLIIASFGMRDTINYFIDGFFDGAMNYTSRIYLTDDATDSERREIIGKYNGDWSSSISVQLEDKPISLDIYFIRNDYIRFLSAQGTKVNYLQLSDDGAYICQRIADEYSLDVGDTVTVSPYGSDKSYDLKVAGVIRSLTESIVITPRYAKRLEIDYTPDSVYIQAADDLSEAAEGDAISSVQSKESIVTGFSEFMWIMNTMIAMLITVAVILGVVVLYNLGIMSYTERSREMATLKVVGFGDKKISRILLGQNMWISLAGVILGLPLGIWLLDYLMKALAPEYELSLYVSPMTFIISAALCFLVSLVV